MAEARTQKTKASVKEFIDHIENEQRRKDCRVVMKMMMDVTGKRPAMWGPSIVGYGSYRYVYASGQAGDWPLTGLSPRKQNLSLYIMSGFDGQQTLLRKLGKHKTGKSCLYVNALDDIDLDVLRELVERSVDHMRKSHECT